MMFQKLIFFFEIWNLSVLHIKNLKNPKLKYFTLKVKSVNNYNYFFVPKKN